MEMGKIDERKQGPKEGHSPRRGVVVVTCGVVSCGGKSRKIILSGGGWGICLQ